MATDPKLYTRLTRNAAGLASYSNLWLASDHLMIVRTTGYHEYYTRLQFADLKGIFLTRTKRRLWCGLAWAAVAVLGLLLMIYSLRQRMTPIGAVVVVALAVVGLIWNHLLGPGCRAYALTGVQTADLPSIQRMKQAQRIVAQIMPLIAAAQAPTMTELAAPAVEPPTTPLPPVAEPPPPPPLPAA